MATKTQKEAVVEEFDPIAEGFTEILNPEDEGFIEISPNGPGIEPVDADIAYERAGKVWDTAVEDDIPLEVANKYFYKTTDTPPSIKHDFLTERFPDNRVGFSEEFKRQWTGKNAVTKIPIAGGVIGALESADLIWAANRLADPKFDYDAYNRKEDSFTYSVGSGPLQQFRTRRSIAGTSANSRKSDRLRIANAIKDFEREQRGLTFGGKVARGISVMPTWMIEFAGTGGLSSLGDDVARKAGERLLRKHVKTIAGKTAIKTARLATGAVVRTSTGLLPRVGEKAVNRQAMIDIGVAKEEGWATSLAKAWGDTVIESFSEETGGVLTKGAAGLVGKLPFGAKFLDKLQSNWIAATGNTADDFATKMLTKSGYSNILAEMGEERVGTLLREATGVSDREGEWGERIWNGMKEDLTLENLGAELVTLLAPASVRRGMTIGASLTEGVTVPTEVEQLESVAKEGSVKFDSPEDAQGFADRAKEIADREGKEYSIGVDLESNTVSVELFDKDGEPIVPKESLPARVVPPSIKEKQSLPSDQTITKDAADAGVVDPIVKVREALRKAEAVIPKTKAEQKAERRKRVGAAAGAIRSNVKKGSPIEESIFKSTGLLKGELTDYEQRYESIEGQLTAEDKDDLYGKIYNHPDLKYFEVVGTATSLKKLLAGTALTDGDVKSIERVFGKSFKNITSQRKEVSGTLEKAVALWKAGLLTGLKTSGLNTLSNMTHSMSETAKDVPASLVDKAISLYTGERSLGLTTKGAVSGVKEGVQKGWKYLRTGYSERDIGKKLDHTKVNFGNSKLAEGLQAYEETIFHLLGAQDQPFYYGAKARSIASQAIAQGKNQGLKGKELDSFVDKLVKSPTDDMIEASVHDAEVAVFQNRTSLGDIARLIQRAEVAGVPVGEIVVPFGRTPSAVATQIVNYTPVGVVNEIATQIRKGEFNQRQLSQAAGRSVLGTGTLWLGGELLKAGLMTLDRPRNERERKLWELEGRKANSIKVGNKWRSVQTLGPIGNVLVVGGHFQHHFSKEGSPTKAIVKSLGGSAKSFSEQTFVKGMNQAVEAMVDPDRSFDNWFSSMAGSTVPTIVSDIARAEDEIERRTEGPLDRFQSRIPGLRKGLPPKLNVFGQDLPRYGGNVLEVMLDPSRPSKINSDVVVDELRRLADISKDFQVTPTLLGGRDGFDVLTDDENTQMWRRQGELTYKALQALVTSEGYEKLDNDLVKKKMLERVVDKTRAAARAEMAGYKLSRGYSVIELAESGLLSVKELDAIKYFGGDGER